MKKLFTFISSLLFITVLSGQSDTLSLSFVHDDSLRSYLLYVPASYDGSEAWPLVINYHGFNNTAASQMHISQMNLVADTANFLIAYPQGLLVNNPFLGFSATGWNIDGTLSDNDDMSFTSQLIDQISAGFAVDPARVYVTGWSMGGNLAFQVSCELPDRIAAVASVANQMSDGQMQNCNPGRPIPALLMHGTADPIVPFEGDGVLFSTAYNTSSFWASQNNCSPDSLVTDLDDMVTTDSSTVTLIEYTNCDADAKVLLYRINSGGHAWPGGAPLPPFFGNVNRDINASSEIWNFFNQFEHPDHAPVPQLLRKTITIDDTDREFLLYVPAAYDGSEEWPLVLNFHGFGGSSEQQVFYSQMNPVADTAHFLIAYPQGLTVDVSSIPNRNPLLPPAGSGWNIYDALSENDDLAFVNQLLDQVDAAFNINESKIYATGYSFGGIMSQYLACTLNDRIAAVASVSASFLEDERFNCTPNRPVPALHIHGTEDNIVPFDGMFNAASADSTIQFWLINNRCSMESSTTNFEDAYTSDSSTVTRIVYENCDNETEVWFYRIDGGGHTWPGGAPVPPELEFLFGNVNRDISASSEIWNFFNRFTLQTTSLPTLSPSELDLQVFPNPFSSQLIFTFELPENSQVQLSVFNQLGQKLTTVVEERLPKGVHRVQWNAKARQLPAGIYYYRLWVNDRFVSRPVVLSRN